MNKKVIFIPLLLLGIQPTNVLSADGDTYEKVRAALEQDREWMKEVPTRIWGQGGFQASEGEYIASNRPEAQGLLDEFQAMLGRDESIAIFPHRYVDTLRRFYPEIKLEVRKLDLKPAKAK